MDRRDRDVRMSDDAENTICGYETAAGTPCELPASKPDDRCHHHTEVVDHADAGRPPALDESDHETILDAAESGLSKAGCARAAGVGEATLHRYLDKHDEFRRSFARARKVGETRLVQGGLLDDEVDTSMAKFLLSTSFDYVKTEKRELEDVTEGDGGFGTTVVLDSEYVDE